MKDYLTLRAKYLRPICLSIALCVFAEAILLVLFGIILFPDGNLLFKSLWALLFCGLGMGATSGSLVSLLVIDRLSNANSAIIATVFIYVSLLGVACNLLCLNLDESFHYFGAHSNPKLFFFNGLIQSIIGGYLLGWFLFTASGKKLLLQLTKIEKPPPENHKGS